MVFEIINVLTFFAPNDEVWQGIAQHTTREMSAQRRVSEIKKILEGWQLTCQFPTCRSPVLCSFDRDNSMYEQQT